MVKFVFKHQYSPSEDDGIDCSKDKGRTQVQFQEECDINTIVRRFGLTGELPDDPRIGQYVDMSNVPEDYASMLRAVRGAEEAFMEFPAELRARFGNDPGAMLAFLQDGKNREEAVELGLVSKPPEVTRDAVKAIDELAAKLVAPKPAA